jgi:hypothetical protein
MTTAKILSGETISFKCSDIDHLVFDEKNKLYEIVFKDQTIQQCSSAELWNLSQECSGVISKIYKP